MSQKTTKSRTRYTIKKEETAAEFAKRVYETEGAEHFKLSKDTTDKLKEARAVGGISITDFAALAQGYDGEHDPFIMKNFGKKVSNEHVPRMELKPYNIQMNDQNIITTKRAFTASETKMFGAVMEEEKVPKSINGAFVAAKQSGIGGVFLWPKFWLNPYQYQDYLVLQDNYANTIAGRILDVIVYFTLANGIKPKLKAKNKHKWGDDKSMSKALKEASWITDVLESVDNIISQSGEPLPFVEFDSDSAVKYIPRYQKSDKNAPTYDTPFQNKWSGLLTLALNFGRGAIVPNVDPDDNKVVVKVNDKDREYRGIPKILQVLHPRDLGFNHIDPLTWKLLGIQVYNSNWIVLPSQMILAIWNNDNPVYGSMHYGYSAMQSMIGSARSLRRIIEVDFPLIAKTRWSGMYWLFFKRKGEGISTAEAEHSSILSSIKLDGINLSLEDDPQADVRVENIDLDPKIMELIEMCKFLIQYMMSQVSMPQGLLFGEQDLNRDTLKTGIQAFVKGPIQKYRKWILDIAGKQYYDRMAATIAAQDDEFKKVLEDWDVIADIDEFKFEDWRDLIQPLMMLEQLTPLTDEARAEILGLDDYEDMLDPDKEPPPMPGKQSFSLEQGKDSKDKVPGQGK